MPVTTHKASSSFASRVKAKLLILKIYKMIIRIIKPYFFRLNPFGFRQYLGNNQILIRTQWGFPLLILGNDTSIGPWLLLKGVWEPHLTSLFNNKVKPGMIVMDIGANMGYYSALFASKGAYVHSFEPNPLFQEVLRKNVFLNAGLRTPKCAVNQCAIGSLESVVQMKFPCWLLGGASILNSKKYSAFLDSDINEPVEIKVITLDQYVKLNNLKKIDVIKIDVEGYEEEALKGATKLISEASNLMLCMEYTKNSYSSSFPSWLFNMFHKAYVPKLKEHVKLEFLEAYERGEVCPSMHFLDIVFVKGHHLP